MTETHPALVNPRKMKSGEIVRLGDMYWNSTSNRFESVTVHAYRRVPPESNYISTRPYERGTR